MELYELAAFEAEKELEKAIAKHGPMRSPLEGWAVIHEEYRELETEVMKQHPDKQAMFKEALQVAAMGLRFLVDLCPEIVLERQGPSLYGCGCRLECGPICVLHGSAKRLLEEGK